MTHDSPAYKADLAIFVAKQNDICRAAISRARCFVRGDVVLAHCGYKTIEAAVLGTVKFAIDELAKSERTFIRKYPD